jgi:hypothetical protein
MLKCEYCGQENAEHLTACSGCATPFASASGPPPVSLTPAQIKTRRHLMIGGISFLVGLGGTIVSYATTESGKFSVFHGAIAFGLAEFIYVFINRKKSYEQIITREAEDAAYEALAQGARLEAQGQTANALALYRKIAEQFPETPVGRDALASIKNLQPPP